MYSAQEILNFQMKDSRIIYQSVFSSLCNYYGQKGESKEIDQIAKEALSIVEDLIKKYPMQEISEVVKNQSKGLPF